MVFLDSMANASAWLRRILGREPSRPQAPDDVCLYAVGDIHGRFDLLTAVVNKIVQHSKTIPECKKSLIFLGDYIDRGPDSKRVIEFLASLPGTLPDWELVFLRGNHDQAVLDFLGDPLFYRGWKSFGAQETLLSYGVTPPLFDDEADFSRAAAELLEKLPPSHLAFLRRLEYCVTKGDYYFVHAGVRPGLPLEEQQREDMLWIREPFLMSNRSFGKVVIHGHTPVERPVRRHNRIGIDTGAHATGRLTVAVLRHDLCTFLDTAPAAVAMA
jgi:serine/threonine protein phosphatase 1